jgi:hypothetical protein
LPAGFFAQQPILSLQNIMLDTAVKRHLELGNLLKHAEDSLMVCSLNFRRQAGVCARLAEDCRDRHLAERRDDRHLAERLKTMPSDDLLAKAESLEELPGERAKFQDQSGLLVS